MFVICCEITLSSFNLQQISYRIVMYIYSTFLATKNACQVTYCKVYSIFSTIQCT